MSIPIKGFEQAPAGFEDAHLRKRDAGEVEEQNCHEERYEDLFEALTNKEPKRYIWFEEHARHKKEHRHVERVDQLVSERGDECKIIVSHYNQYNANPFCNIHISNALYQSYRVGNGVTQLCCLSLLDHRQVLAWEI